MTKMLLFFDRVKSKIQKLYRCRLFREKTGCACPNLQISGKIYVINRNIRVGVNCLIMPGVQFFGDGPIVLGDGVSIGNNTMLYASKDGGITIGDNTMVAADCYIIDADHGIRVGTPICKQPNTVKRVQIGSDVWLATGVKVLRGSEIGDGAVIGALSLVKGKVESNAVACGIPAKLLKYREG